MREKQCDIGGEVGQVGFVEIDKEGKDTRTTVVGLNAEVYLMLVVEIDRKGEGDRIHTDSCPCRGGPKSAFLLHLTNQC